MIITIKSPPSWGLGGVVEDEDSENLMCYKPLFFKGAGSKSTHNSFHLSIYDNIGNVLDVVTLVIDGDTGRVSLRHQSLDPVEASADVKGKR